MSDCLFCDIVAGRVPSQQVYRDERVTAFQDIHPITKTHILIVPNRHIASINEMETSDEPLVGYLFSVARRLAQEAGVDQSGYRLMINTGADAGQTVFHLHLHLLGGQRVHLPKE